MHLYLGGAPFSEGMRGFIQAKCEELEIGIIDPRKSEGVYDELMPNRNLGFVRNCDVVFINVEDYDIGLGRWIEAHYAKERGIAVIILASPESCAHLEDNPWVPWVSTVVKELTEGNVADILEFYSQHATKPILLRRSGFD